MIKLGSAEKDALEVAAGGPIVSSSEQTTTTTTSTAAAAKKSTSKRVPYADLYKQNEKYSKEFNAKIVKEAKNCLAKLDGVKKKWTEKKKAVIFKKLEHPKTCIIAGKKIADINNEIVQVVSDCQKSFEILNQEIDRFQDCTGDCMESLLSLTRSLHSKIEAAPIEPGGNFRYKSNPIISGALKDSPFMKSGDS